MSVAAAGGGGMDDVDNFVLAFEIMSVAAAGGGGTDDVDNGRNEKKMKAGMGDAAGGGGMDDVNNGGNEKKMKAGMGDDDNGGNGNEKKWKASDIEKEEKEFRESLNKMFNEKREKKRKASDIDEDSDDDEGLKELLYQMFTAKPPAEARRRL